ncbi:CAAX prenyl protease-related protein [Candidatus Woesearchaeota archaeon RBG_13_36_6]|nr:MAG: CAAX prenyl protease-related protein [Candidatus Woesearchaeota archaeon RBG_13_36_6]
MKAYLIPLLLYILTPLILDFFIKNIYISYFVGIILTGILLFYYRKHYKIKLRIKLLSFIIGIIIFLCWISIPNIYPFFISTQFVPTNTSFLLFKLLAMISVVPLTEELFTRGFLIRYFAAKEWKKVPTGKFTWLSFIVTVLFFGFSHNRWLPGLIVGILLNILLYKTKNLGDCIIAHGFANLLVGLYVTYTNSWFLW